MRPTESDRSKNGCDTPGFGLGYRDVYERNFLDSASTPFEWAEVVSDNFLVAGGYARFIAAQLREHYRIAAHGVGLSIASPEGIDATYLRRLRAFVRWLKPAFVSDHLSWSRLGLRNSHDLLPVALTVETLEILVARVQQVQNELGQRFFLENPSAYVAYSGSTFGEADFLEELCARTGCGILLDVNNLIVNQANLGIDAANYIRRLSPHNVGYMHVAGHAEADGVLIDTHDASAPAEVLALLRFAARRFPDAPVIIERDGKFPDFGDLKAELIAIREICEDVRRETLDMITQASVAISRDALPLNQSHWSATATIFWNELVEDAPAGTANNSDVFSSGPVPVVRGINVYRDAYAIRMAEGLGYNFSATHRLAGEAKFANLRQSYLKAYPPVGSSTADIGRDFPGYLRAALPNDPLGDVAAFERGLLAAQELDVTEEAYALARLASLSPSDWASLRLNFIPALHVDDFSYRVDPKALQNAASCLDIERLPQRTCFIFYRSDRDVHFQSLDPAAARLLRAMLDGQTLHAASGAAGLVGEEGIAFAASSIVEWTRLGLVKEAELA